MKVPLSLLSPRHGRSVIRPAMSSPLGEGRSLTRFVVFSVDVPTEVADVLPQRLIVAVSYRRHRRRRRRLSLD